MKTARQRRQQNRKGFSLLELLVVISIIAILLALSMAGVMRIRAAGQTRSSSDLVEKVQLALNNQYKAIIDQARTDIRSQAQQDAVAMLNYSGGDQDMALSLLTYCRIRQSFPQTFAEVQTFTVAGYTFQVKSQFHQFQGATDTNTNAYSNQQAYLQSAVLLYAAVAQTGAGGSVLTNEATNTSVASFTVGTVTANAYKDAWGQPVGFCRFGTNTELQSAPYAATTKMMPGASVLYLDPLDPAGKLYTWANNKTYNAQAVTIAGSLFPSNGDPANATFFDATNRVPVVYSIGMNQTYESLGMNLQSTIKYPTNDDILGYRLTQLGQKGSVNP